jgi:hypothetical protein
MRLNTLFSETFVYLIDGWVLPIFFAITPNLVHIKFLLLNKFNDILMFDFGLIWIIQIYVFLVLIPWFGCVVAHFVIVLLSLEWFEVLWEVWIVLTDSCDGVALV